MDSTLGADTDTATLAWLASALEQARAQGQWKAVGYLEAVADDVQFRTEMAASSGLLWFNYRGVDFSGAEETIYGALFGVSVFGLMLSLLLALMA